MFEQIGQASQFGVSDDKSAWEDRKRRVQGRDPQTTELVAALRELLAK